jgi:hypothetical protein
VDRLDIWLNAQRGWRRLLLMLATCYGSTLVLSYGIWGLSTSEFAVPALDTALIAVLAIPGAVCIGSVMATSHARRARNPRRKKGQPPFFMWRTTVGLWLLSSELLLGIFNPPVGHHRWVIWLMLILLGGYLLLVLETLRYKERFTRPREGYLPDSMGMSDFLLFAPPSASRGRGRRGSGRTR